jgi:UDP-3-O-[3-hydroxymyristoyl] N-acetylglucosamine deacetylase
MAATNTSHTSSWQHTLAGELTCVGRGLHSGQPVSMRLRSASPDTGIRFQRMDVEARHREVVANWRNVVESELCTVITNEHGVTVGTIEHLMAALHGCKIDNAIIELDGPEVPIMDGSAAPFVTRLRRIGSVVQTSARQALLINKPIVAADGDRYAVLLPDPQSRVTVEINFPNPVIGRQRYSMALEQDVFVREIAAARTFGFAHEVQAMRARGLATGGSLSSAILVDEYGVVNEEGLRFPDEFVRHKLLDCIGDLSLLGVPIIGHLVTYKPGHRLCHRLLQALDASADAASLITLGGHTSSHVPQQTGHAHPTRHEKLSMPQQGKTV